MKITFDNKEELERFMAVFGVGVTEFVKEQKMDYSESWDWVFGREVTNELEHLKASNKLIKLLDSGNELCGFLEWSKSRKNENIFRNACEQLKKGSLEFSNPYKAGLEVEIFWDNKIESQQKN